jgi:amino acid transporter
MRILLTLNGLAEYFFFFLTVLGAIILRWREPELHRPVKPFVVRSLRLFKPPFSLGFGSSVLFTITLGGGSFGPKVAED